jgi:hypothetical protein
MYISIELDHLSVGCGDILSDVSWEILMGIVVALSRITVRWEMGDIDGRQRRSSSGASSMSLKGDTLSGGVGPPKGGYGAGYTIFAIRDVPSLQIYVSRRYSLLL